MSVETRTVAEDEADLRVDRWFKRHYPALGHGRLEKLLRTGQIRVDGGRVKANHRLEAGQSVRVPPLGDLPDRPAKVPARVRDADAEALRAAVLHKDDQVIALNKPPGLAVQGGSGTTRHLDAMLDALRFDAKERPRLVHRLDKDTSGVLLLARSASAAARLAAAFRGRDARKLYWAVTVGAPRPANGRIDLHLAKQGPKGAERVEADDEDGKRAVTLYRTLDRSGKRAAFLALMPLTGRTHQLRAHCVALGTPILGDGKYGGAMAFLEGEAIKGLSRRLHLHARALDIAHPARGRLRVTAEPPGGFRETMTVLGFVPGDEADDLEIFEEA